MIPTGSIGGVMLVEVLVGSSSLSSHAVSHASFHSSNPVVDVAKEGRGVGRRVDRWRVKCIEELGM
jgi:hypothetical protein